MPRQARLTALRGSRTSEAGRHRAGRSTKRRLLVGAGALPIVVLAPYAVAAWLASGTGVATAAASSINAVATAPIVNTVGASARVSWPAATLAGGVGVEGYRVM